MKKCSFILHFFLLSGIAFSQPGDQRAIFHDPQAEARIATGFNAIKVSSGIDLIIKQGDEEGIAVSASREAFRNMIKTVVKNGVLHIYFEDINFDRKNFWKRDKSNKKLKAYVSVKTLDRLTGSTGANITINGRIIFDKLMIDLSSGSNFKGEVHAAQLDVDQSTGATARLNGEAQSLNVETSTGSGFYGFNLMSDVCNARVTSGGFIEITVNKEMIVKANTGGGIRYKGNGVIKTISTNTGGSVSKRS